MREGGINKNLSRGPCVNQGYTAYLILELGGPNLNVKQKRLVWLNNSLYRGCSNIQVLITLLDKSSTATQAEDWSFKSPTVLADSEGVTTEVVDRDTVEASSNPTTRLYCIPPRAGP
jgi:hypothetical protein